MSASLWRWGRFQRLACCPVHCNRRQGVLPAPAVGASAAAGTATTAAMVATAAARRWAGAITGHAAAAAGVATIRGSGAIPAAVGWAGAITGHAAASAAVGRTGAITRLRSGTPKMAPLASAATRGPCRIHALPGRRSAALSLAGPPARSAEVLPVAGCRAIALRRQGSPAGRGAALRAISAHVSAVCEVRLPAG